LQYQELRDAGEKEFKRYNTMRLMKEKENLMRMRTDLEEVVGPPKESETEVMQQRIKEYLEEKTSKKFFSEEIMAKVLYEKYEDYKEKEFKDFVNQLRTTLNVYSSELVLNRNRDKEEQEMRKRIERKENVEFLTSYLHDVIDEMIEDFEHDAESTKVRAECALAHADEPISDLEKLKRKFKLKQERRQEEESNEGIKKRKKLAEKIKKKIKLEDAVMNHMERDSSMVQYLRRQSEKKKQKDILVNKIMKKMKEQTKDEKVKQQIGGILRKNNDAIVQVKRKKNAPSNSKTKKLSLIAQSQNNNNTEKTNRNF